MSVHRRTFEARRHPKGSAERKALNEDSRTSEYMTSHRYVAVGDGYRLTFRTKTGAVAFDKERGG